MYPINDYFQNMNFMALNFRSTEAAKCCCRNGLDPRARWILLCCQYSILIMKLIQRSVWSLLFCASHHPQKFLFFINLKETLTNDFEARHPIRLTHKYRRSVLICKPVLRPRIVLPFKCLCMILCLTYIQYATHCLLPYWTCQPSTQRPTKHYLKIISAFGDY